MGRALFCKINVKVDSHAAHSRREPDVENTAVLLCNTFEKNSLQALPKWAQAEHLTTGSFS